MTPMIALGPQIEAYRIANGWADDSPVAQSLGISLERLSDLKQESVHCNGTLATGGHYPGRPDFDSPSPSSVHIIAEQYEIDAAFLTEIITHPSRA